MNITSVRVSDAVSWIGETFAIIKDRLLLWLLAGLLFVISVFAVNVVNQLVQYLAKGSFALSLIVIIVGSLLVGAFTLILTVGMMDCVKTQTESETFSVGQLFTFAPLFGKFLILQLLVTLMTVALMLVIFLVAYLLKLQFFLLYGLLSLNMGVIIPLILCAIVYTVILGNGMLFAAALVAFDEVPPFEAFKLGLSAATRNFFSLLISFILIILLLIVIGFIAGFIGVFLTKLGVVGLIISVVLGLSLLFLVISYMYGFSYHAYNGVFGDNLKY